MCQFSVCVSVSESFCLCVSICVYVIVCVSVCVCDCVCVWDIWTVLELFRSQIRSMQPQAAQTAKFCKNRKLGVFNQKFNLKHEEQEKSEQDDSERKFHVLSENRIRFSVAIAVLTLQPDL